jgi:hypothetical protein
MARNYTQLDEPGKAQTGVAEPEEPKTCFDKYKGFVAAVFLSTLTATLFLLRSGPLASSTCSNVILMLCEAIKFAVALTYVVYKGQTGRLFQSIPLAFVPVTSYVAVNLLSFWALKYVHASLGALMSQIKLPATAIFSRVFLGRVVSFDRTMALFSIFFGALAIAAYGQMEKEDEAESGQLPANAADVAINAVPMLTYVLATIALLGESCLSAGTGVFTQWVFKSSMDTLWVRNAQFGVLSIIQYAVLQFVIEDNTGECETSFDTRGVVVGILYASMGISVALTILWLGAIEKTLASVSSVVLTTLGDHVFVLHTMPTLLELSVAAVIINGIIHFSGTK